MHARETQWRRRACRACVAALLLWTVAVHADDAAAAECPVGDDASGMETGEKGLQFIKAGELSRAAACFWRAVLIRTRRSRGPTTRKERSS